MKIRCLESEYIVSLEASVYDLMQYTMNDMKHEISSASTRFYKFVFPFLWIGFIIVFAIMAIMAFAERDINYYSVSIAFAMLSILTLFIFRWSKRLKRIFIDEEFLYISDFKSEISIRFTDILRIRQSFLGTSNPETVKISLKINTVWGTEIYFVPEQRMFNLPEHPIIQ